jgi:pyroglutamyl-peptidase
MHRHLSLIVALFGITSVAFSTDPAPRPGRIVISGFEPFGGRKFNASFKVARRVAELNADRNITLLEIPVVWGAPEKTLAKEKAEPWSLWVAFGEGTRCFSIETVADNQRDDYADNEQKKPLQPRILPDAPEQLITPFPVEALAHALRNCGLPVRVSKEAGNYLCEEMFFNLLQARSQAKDQVPIVLFIHTPIMSAKVKMPDGKETLMDEALIYKFAQSILPCIQEAIARPCLKTLNSRGEASR